MRLNKFNIIYFFIYAIFFVFSLSGIIQSNTVLTGFSIIVYLYMVYLVNSKSSIHMMFFLGFTTFIFVPAILNNYYLDISYDVFFLTSFVSVFFLYFTNNTQVNEFIDYGRFSRYGFLVFSFLLIALIFWGGDLVNYFIAFFIFFLSLCFKQNKIKNNTCFFIVFLIIFFSYMLIGWNGFGRTVIFGWLLLAILQYSYSINIKINKIIFCLFPALGPVLLTKRNFFELSFLGFENALNDSAYGPYRLVSTFLTENNNSIYDFSGLVDQFLFTFFVFIPRSVWPNKPYGFGYEYTVRELDISLVHAGHSVASTLIGDHIYFLGYWGVVTGLITLLIFAFFINLFYRIKGLNGNGVLIFSASMMVLVWGGMSSFSARVALPLIIFLTLYIIFKRVFFHNAV